MKKLNVYIGDLTKPKAFEIDVDQDMDKNFYYHLYIWCEEKRQFLLTRSSNTGIGLLDENEDDFLIVINRDGLICMKYGDTKSIIS